MITLFIIIVVIAIISSSSNDKSKKEQAKAQQVAKQIPDLYIKGKKLTSKERALNLWPSEYDILDVFQFNSADSSIYLKMLDGRSIHCPLSNLEVDFGDMNNGMYRFGISYGKTSFSFYNYAYVFSDEEYNAIANVLLLAGITHNTFIFSNSYKFCKGVNSAARVYNKLNR